MIPPLPPIGRRNADQMMAYSASSNHLDNDPFASSAPAVSLFHQFNNEQLWRQSPRSNGNMISNDFIGLRSSPRESSDHLLASSPFSNNRLSCSVQSTSYNRQQQQQDLGYDLNDAMLPSSLNDLFTPRELQVRRVRQQETSSESFMSYSLSRTASSFDINNWTSRDISQQQQQWRVPFLTKSTQNEMMAMTCPDYDDNSNNRLCTAAINIPGGGTSSSSGTGSSGSYLLQQEDLLSSLSQLQIQDDEVQFFMEDDEAVDHKTFDMTHNSNNTSSTTNDTTVYTFPSLISLPST
jgi:hypothetical protein